jgi:AbrB family looped-hinge helix DNA binding protein
MVFIDGQLAAIMPAAVNTTPKADTVRFTAKGQVVIPARLRKRYHIEDGTRAIVTPTPEGILLQPVTRHAIDRLRGILKRKPGEPPMAEWWVEHKRQERER